jgi:SAM-dependent methyltransferase
MSEWHETDAWWAQAETLLFPADKWAQAPAQVEAVLALAGVTAPARVLDMPCGTGRHSLAFARLGYAVTGVDRTGSYIEDARQEAREAGLDAEFVVGDMRKFRHPDAFDLAVNLYTSFGYFEDPAEDLAVLDNFHASLRPGGVLVMEMVGKEVLARIFQAREWLELDDGTLFLQERQVNRDWTWLEGRWIMIGPDGGRQEQFFEHRIYGASDLKWALTTTGFGEVTIYGGLEGLAYDQHALRLVAVARK